MTGFEAASSGVLVTCGSFSVEIIPECLALPAMAIYAAGVVAYNAPPRHKIVGLAAGLAVIWVANVVRLATLVVVGSRFSREVFRTMHIYMWQTCLIVLVCLTWLAWLRKVPAR